jgi:hypothetical protein
MNVKSITPCEYARKRHLTLLRWRNFWTLLLFVFGAGIILFYSGAIFLFIRELWLLAALATVGIIVSGIGIKWVVKRRFEAVKEEEKAYSDVVQYYDN